MTVSATSANKYKKNTLYGRCESNYFSLQHLFAVCDILDLAW